MTDELLACYIDGVATAEEQVFVREYLAANPEEYERVLYMMDMDMEDYIGGCVEDTTQSIPLKETSFANIAYSAAAFVPQMETKLKNHNALSSKKITSLYKRLYDLCEELN